MDKAVAFAERVEYLSGGAQVRYHEKLTEYVRAVLSALGMEF